MKVQKNVQKEKGKGTQDGSIRVSSIRLWLFSKTFQFLDEAQSTDTKAKKMHTGARPCCTQEPRTRQAIVYKKRREGTGKETRDPGKKKKELTGHCLMRHRGPFRSASLCVVFACSSVRFVVCYVSFRCVRSRSLGLSSGLCLFTFCFFKSLRYCVLVLVALLDDFFLSCLVSGWAG